MVLGDEAESRRSFLDGRDTEIERQATLNAQQMTVILRESRCQPRDLIPH